MMDAKLLDLLVCPVTKGKLKYDRENGYLISRQAKLIFPIIDGIPRMQLDTALPLKSLNEPLNQPLSLDEHNDLNDEKASNDVE